MSLKLIKFFLIFTLFFFNKFLFAKEIWILDKELSNINFEIPVLFANNVKGSFNDIEGIIEIDPDKKLNNKGIFSVKLESLKINYNKYKSLLLSEVFFDIKNYPIALVDTKKFQYKNEKKITIEVELNIKNISQKLPVELEIINLASELVQIKGNLKFPRTSFNLGEGTWSNTTILREKVIVELDFFLFKNN